MRSGTPSWKPIPLCWKWNQPNQTGMEWQHSKIRGMKLNVQDLVVWSPAAHITNQIRIRRGCAGFPSLIRLTPSAAEKDGWANICSWKKCEWKTPTAMLIIPDEKVAVVVCLGQQMLESPNHIVHEDLLSSRSNKRVITSKSVRPKRLFPWKVVTVLPSIQGNLLSRETTNSYHSPLRRPLQTCQVERDHILDQSCKESSWDRNLKNAKPIHKADAFL